MRTYIFEFFTAVNLKEASPATRGGPPNNHTTYQAQNPFSSERFKMQIKYELKTIKTSQAKTNTKVK